MARNMNFSDDRLYVLVADPEAESSRVIAGCLDDLDAVVLRARTTREALDLLLSRRFDFAVISREFSDSAPGELLQQVVGRWQKLPVIVVTNTPSVAAAVLCLKSGAVDYVEKPVDITLFTQLAGGVIDEIAHTAQLQTRELQLLEEVIGDYRVLEELGAGAVATVYRAESMMNPDAKPVALKILRGGIVNDDIRRVALERFIREAEIASEIEHPNVVRLHDYGLASDSMLPFIAYELVDGQCLTHYIVTGSLPIEERIRLLEQAASALAAIHDAGIIHRDFKPDNLLITPDLVLKVSDFGVSRRAESDLTQADCTIGTPFYLAPESLSSRPVDARADQFSLGCVAYELLTGKRPFPGNSLPEIIRGIRKEEPPNPQACNDEILDDLAEVVARLLDKNPANRYTDCHEIEQTLADCRRNLPVAAAV